MKIYGDLNSGNCLKVKWTADYLHLPYDWQFVDIMKGETKTADYLERFPFGQVPAVELSDGSKLVQSNAIIRYLAHGTPLLPVDPLQAAKVDEWLFWEQYSHEPYIAVCRFHMVYKGQSKQTREGWRVERGEVALDQMDEHLKANDWLAGDHVSVADIALLPYTQLANEGGFNLEGREHLASWIDRTVCELGCVPENQSRFLD